MNYDEMTIADLLVTAHQQAHPENNPSSEQSPLIDELVTRLRRLDHWRNRVSAEINPYLTEEDGSDLISEPHRIRNMLQRLSAQSENHFPDVRKMVQSVSNDELEQIVHRLNQASDGASAMGWEQDSYTFVRAAFVLQTFMNSNEK